MGQLIHHIRELSPIDPLSLLPKAKQRTTARNAAASELDADVQNILEQALRAPESENREV